MKVIYSYSELGTLIDQGMTTTFTRPALVRVSMSKPNDKSDTIKASINLLIGDYSISVFEDEYKNILDILATFDINDNGEIWEVSEEDG
jgi:hypothetical protein